MLSQEDPNTLFAKNLAKILRTLQKNLCVRAPLIHAKVLPGSVLLCALKKLIYIGSIVKTIVGSHPASVKLLYFGTIVKQDSKL